MPLLTSIAIVTGATLVGAVAAPLALAGIGFTTAGVAAGSAAAGMQAGIGNVVAGSLFATAQSLGTAPLITAAIGAVSGAGTALAGVGSALGLAALL
ncbi:hypothetical protein FRC17_009805 [Serendipita sp. 399]|nr:hypothetical protein FRC17_009805 [Serendipita sp. 399]